MNQNPPTPGSTPPSGLARQATAREFLAVLFRRKWIILGLFLVTTATVMIVALSTPTSYISSGRILVKRGERQTVLRPDRQVFSEWEQELGSEMQIVKSMPVVRRAREIFNERAKASGEEQTFDPTSIDVEVMGKSNVLAIGYISLDPSLSQTACEAVIDAYMEYRRSRLNTDGPRRFFDQQIADLEAQIESKMQERKTYSEHSGVAVPLATTNSLLAQVTVLEQRRSDMAADLAGAQTVEQAMRRMQEDPDVDLPTFDGAQHFTNESALINLKMRIVDQQTKIALLTETLRDDAPEVVGARQTLETLQALLRKEVDARVRMAGSRVAQMRSRLDVVDQQLAGIRTQLSQAPNDLKTMDELDAELINLRSRLKSVSESRDQALITANTAPDMSVVLLSPAGVAIPTNPLDVVRLLLAPAFSLLVGIAIAFFIDGLDLTVRTTNQAEEYLDLPVLASLSERRRRSG
ncbi:MAG: hypothetical protein RL721_938 [Candidatus Eisenbacteria bacterium]|jgi:polysaccharide biosynthesis transport protein